LDFDTDAGTFVVTSEADLGVFSFLEPADAANNVEPEDDLLEPLIDEKALPTAVDVAVDDFVGLVRKLVILDCFTAMKP